MPYDPPPELASMSLAEIANLAANRKLPPLDRWSPTKIGDSHMRIAADGKWYHDGGEITRPAMVRAFSALLMCDEGGKHWLVTPHERLSIDVDDAAFQAVDLKQEGGAIAFRLNTDELIVAGREHPIEAEGDTNTPALYVVVRHGTRARLNRSTYAQLAELAIAGGDLSVSSNGETFTLVPQ